jgi:hypothetical protein
MDEKIRAEHNDVEHAAQNGQAATDRYVAFLDQTQLLSLCEMLIPVQIWPILDPIRCKG